MKKYPFKFLDAYTREDRGVFFGRDEEINTLYDLVFQSSVVLVYGGSGTGKTSLINCGLAGKFEPHDWLPLMVRRGSNINDALQKALNDAGGKLDEKAESLNELDEWENDSDEDAKTLSPIGKSLKAVYQHFFRPIYLIFDQFEELFILGSLAEQKQFIQTIQDILDSGQPVKLIFSMREEYLGYLMDFERAVPQLLRKKLRVEPMNLEKVKQVIIGASEFKDSNITIKKGEQDAVAEGIFEKIKGNKKSLTIQLPFLQVFLDKFYLEITGDKSRMAEAEFNVKTLKKMGEIGDILINFMEEQVAVITNELGKTDKTVTQEIIWKILSPFSTLEGTKEPITKPELYERLPNLDKKMVDRVVEAFIQGRMLRYNEGTDTYELAHDALAKPIAEKRSVEDNTLLEIKRLISSQVSVNKEAREFFTEKQLLFIEPYSDKIVLHKEELDWINQSKVNVEEQKALKRREETKKRRQKLKWILTISGLVLVVIIYTTISLILNRQKEIQHLLTEEKIKIENQAKKAELELLMTGGSDRYAILKDSTLSEKEKDTLISKILYLERSYPIDSLIIPRAYRSPSNIKISGSTKTNYNYLLWIDVPTFRRDEIKEVHYNLCDGFVDPIRVSNEPTSSFAIGYLGWGACKTMSIDIILKNGDPIIIDFEFIKYLCDHGLWNDCEGYQ